jgi:ech hydrogenase subunit D
MLPNQNFEVIVASQLLDSVRQMRNRRARLVQICATALPDALELTYTFDVEAKLANLRILVDKQDTVPSITPIYACAFLYENEMHDLFNLQVANISVDFKGTLYTTRLNFAFDGTSGNPAKNGKRSNNGAATATPAPPRTT